MSQLLAWDRATDRGDVLRQAVEALRAGKVVAFPTETVYGVAASALLPDAVARLGQSKRRPEAKPLALAVGDPAVVLDWVPTLGPLGRRLVRRCLPGPVTLVFDVTEPDGLVGRLPPGVRERVCPRGTVGLRVPQHEAILQVLRLLPGPLVLSSANTSGQPPATTAQEVIEALGDEVDLVIDAGPTHYGQASTVIHVQGDQWRVLREGVVSAADLGRLTACVIVFVCTGNTCRSPLAEALCKKLLADRLGCRIDELPDRGFLVLSAGLAAMMGGEAAAEAVEAARELGADLSAHASRPLSPTLAAQADYLIAMTQGHAQALASQLTGGPRPRLLCADGSDVPDPIGADQQVYRECAQQIQRALEELLAELQPS